MNAASWIRWTEILAYALFALTRRPAAAAAPPDADPNSPAVTLPSGVTAVWEMAKAYHETTPTRERICLNGLWRWQPAATKADAVPDRGWGFFKVPGCWPGITDYMQKDSQTLFASPDWKDVRLGGLTAAWYEREFKVPANWTGRRISLSTETLNSLATVFVDGARAGEIHFPGGELDLTAVCPPGTKHRLSLLVLALPLKGVMLSYVDTAAAREVKGTVERRGLCGDVFLVSTPAGPKITDVRIGTSFRQREISISTALEGLASDGHYQLRAHVMQGGSVAKEFSSPSFPGSALTDGRIDFRESWLPDQLWDLDTPQNHFDLELSLIAAGGQILDTGWTQRFGFREFWIDGRDFYLNGQRIFLSAVPLDNAQVGASLANYAAAREGLGRLKDIGINYVYTHNYSCEPGTHLSFAEILRAADDVGMLVGFTQPHFSHYEWKAPGADTNNGYARTAAAYVRATENHPSVVMYVMSHNATGYDQDMNPDLIDGLHEARDSWSAKNVQLALRAEAIVRRLDPRRIVYHHASGNLGVMHDSNFYPNFAPVQELDDWFGHWATAGVKPAFTCEYGAPFTWDWTLYRGWYQEKREWGSAQVPWEFCVAEWNAQFLGDRAFQISDAEKQNLRWEARQLHAGRVWHRWDYPNPVGSDRFDEQYPILAKYLTDNWRAYRTWGVSGISPWEYAHYWKLRPGLDRGRRELPVDWANLQRPGFSPDYLDQRYEQMDMAYERADWIATPAAEALQRNNRPLLAYIAGEPAAFTGKNHHFTPGETVLKQILLINNSRRVVTCDASWSIDLTPPIAGTQSVTIPAGDQARLPVEIKLPGQLAPGGHTLHLTAKFNTGETQEDRFAIDILPAPEPAIPRDVGTKIALFDPKGETAAMLRELGVAHTRVEAGVDLSAYDILVIGKAALTVDGPAPDVSRVRDGLKVILFEQTTDVLAKRLGFRVTEYGLRQVFPRVVGHPVLTGITTENLRDWRGSATLLPPQLDFPLKSPHGPAVDWAGRPETRVWRCGNRGNVASVLIEKPARGDFLSIVDGGFSLQFSPLMEYREGRGMMIFCQLDLTGRTESDPVAEALTRRLVRYVADWKPGVPRQAVYAGDADGKAFLETLVVNARAYDGHLSTNDVLVLAAGATRALGRNTAMVADFVKSGGHLLAIGLNSAEAEAVLPIQVTMKNAEHISSFFASPGVDSVFAGIGPANVHNRDPRELPLVTGGAQILGNGVLAKAVDANVFFVQMAPWTFSREPSFRRTFRQSSVMLNRVLANLGVAGSTSLLQRFQKPASKVDAAKPGFSTFYLDAPQEWDDPYRFFRW